MEATITSIFPPNPLTREGYGINFIASPDRQWLGFCTKKSVVLKNMENPNQSKLFELHTKPLVSLAFHPNGTLVASADESNTIHIWDMNTLKTEVKIESAFQGKINGMNFISGGNNLLIYGEGGKNKVKVMDWKNSKAIGEIGGISSNVYSGSGCSSQPDNFLIGTESGEIFYFVKEGDEYIIKNRLQAHQIQKIVSSILPSPDGTKFITVSFDKKILTFDPVEGKVIDTIDATKVENGHKMAIISAAFIDDDRFLTASLDKTVRVWNLKEKKVLASLILKEGKLDAQYKLCGVQTNGKTIYAIALNSIIYSWNLDTIADNKLPDMYYLGHKGNITSIIYDKEGKNIVSGDNNGTIIFWPNEGKGQPVSIESGMSYIKDLCFSQDKSFFLAVDGKGAIVAYDKATLTQKYKVKELGGGPISLVMSRKNNEDSYVLFSDFLVILKNDREVKRIKISYKACAFDINEDLGEFLIGDRKGTLHILDMEGKEKGKKDIHYGEYCIMKLSPDGKLIASGDNQKNIIILDAATKEKVCDKFYNHSSKITGICWTQDSKYLASCSLDCRCITWNVEEKKKINMYSHLDRELLSSVCFTNDDNEIACGGAFSAMKILNFTK